MKSNITLWRRRTLSILLSIVLVAAFNACNPRNLPIVKDLAIASEKERTRHTAELIESSKQMKQLDNVCAQIPVPDSFQFVWKDGYNDEHKLVASYYLSEISFNESQEIWRDYFIKEGWEVSVDNMSYPKLVSAKKKPYIARIYYGGMGERTNYSIGCELINTDLEP